jgi:hypothetical protein
MIIFASSGEFGRCRPWRHRTVTFSGGSAAGSLPDPIWIVDFESNG